jgi:hypothetical protein
VTGVDQCGLEAEGGGDAEKELVVDPGRLDDNAKFGDATSASTLADDDESRGDGLAPIVDLPLGDGTGHRELAAQQIELVSADVAGDGDGSIRGRKCGKVHRGLLS